jgi:hypothetical protein
MWHGMRKLWLGGATAFVMAAAALGVLAVPTSSAHAQEWFGVHIGPFGFGFGAPYYYSPYYYPYYHYYYPYGYRWGYPY